MNGVSLQIQGVQHEPDRLRAVVRFTRLLVGSPPTFIGSD